jgi:hypothetical protein
MAADPEVSRGYRSVTIIKLKKNGRRLKQSLWQHTDEQQKSAKAVVAKRRF